MGRNYLFLMSLFFGLMIMGLSSACPVSVENATIVGGMISVEGNGVGGASVNVTCYHNDGVNMINTTSNTHGFYSVVFEEDDCNYGDLVNVSASSNGLTGFSNNIMWLVDDLNVGCLDLDIGIVNVPLVPEFGFFVGMLTILSATVVFFVVRKE